MKTQSSKSNNSTGAVSYLHHDQAASTRLLTSPTGAKEASFTYDAYGNTTGTTGTATTPLGYDGQYTSTDTKLIYLRARTYDPTTAQFLSVDPLSNITRSLYGYAHDNPLNGADPTGLLAAACETPAESARRTRLEELHRLLERETEELNEEKEKENETEGERINNHIQLGCDLSGPAILVGLRKVPGVAQVAGAFCLGFTGGRLLTGQNVGG